jgi:hypothetical protein
MTYDIDTMTHTQLLDIAAYYGVKAEREPKHRQEYTASAQEYASAAIRMFTATNVK